MTISGYMPAWREDTLLITKMTGLPPFGDTGTFIGFDENRLPYILRWNYDNSAWQGVGFDPKVDGRMLGFVFLALDDMADFIVAHAALV